MALNLHPSLQNKLIQELADILPNLKIIRGIGLTDESYQKLLPLDAALPGHGEIFEKLRQWISDRPLSDFVIGTINRVLLGDSYEDGSHQPLESLPDWKDSQSKAIDLISKFESLPEFYVVSFPAPRGLEKYILAEDGEFRVSKTVRLSISDETFKKLHPVSTGNSQKDHSIWDRTVLGGLLSKDKVNYEWNGAYLQILKEGFLGRFNETSTEHDIKSEFKALWGTQIALGIAQIRRTWTAMPRRKKLIVHRRTGVELDLELLLRIELDSATSQLSDDIVFNDWIPDHHDIAARQNFYKQELGRIDLIFGSSPEAQRLRLAARWLFDSYATENELLAYVQAMVCLEIILGDASLIGEIGLGELLRNRCAYLIGKDSTQRNQILKDFKEIYDIRSHIVHRGKSRMTVKEREHYSRLIWYCKRCIDEELKLLQDAQNKR